MDILPLLDEINIHYDKIKNEIGRKQLELDLKMEEINEENHSLKIENQQLEHKLNKIMQEVSNLEEENASFKKVSRIIAVEKENTCLREKLKKYESFAIASTKKINGTIYFLSNDCELFLDKQLRVPKGKYEKTNGKAKVTWY